MFITMTGHCTAPVIEHVRDVSCEVSRDAVVPSGQASPDNSLELSIGGSAAWNNVAEVAPMPSTWGRLDEVRFIQMAAKFSTGALTTAESREYERLKSVRRMLHHPRTGHELLMEHRRQQVADELSKALDSYVSFISTTRR